MAVSDDPAGSAPITHVYDAWLSVARLASAGVAPTIKVLATTMAATNIFFIAFPLPRATALWPGAGQRPAAGHAAVAIADLPALPPVKGDVKTPFTVQARETHEGASSWLSSDPGMARPPCRDQPHGGACPGGRCQASGEANVSTISRSRTPGAARRGENF